MSPCTVHVAGIWLSEPSEDEMRVGFMELEHSKPYSLSLVCLGNAW